MSVTNQPTRHPGAPGHPVGEPTPPHELHAPGLPAAHTPHPPPSEADTAERPPLDPWSLLHPIPELRQSSSGKRADGAVVDPPVRARAKVGDALAGLALSGLLLYLLALPLIDAQVGVRVTWTIYGVFALVAGTRLARAGHGWGVAVVAVLPWIVWVLTWPSWSAWAPDSRVVRTEQASLLACGLLCLAGIALGAGTRSGALLHRRAWLTLGVVVVPIGLWEITTQQHLGPGPWRPPPWSAAATFVNPNHFAAVLLVVYGLAALRLSERLSRLDRLATGVLALATMVVIVATWSRLAVAAALVLTLAALCLDAQRRGVFARRRVENPAATHAMTRRAGSRGRSARRLLLSLLGGGLAALVLAPALARYLFPGDAATARADGLRVTLLRIGLDAWSTRPWLGIGGGRFETVLEERGFEPVLPMHNGFVEILTEYGLVVAAPMLAWIVAIVCSMLTRRRVLGSPDVTRGGRPRGLDTLGARYAIGVWLVAFVVAGFVTSSAVGWPFWYLMAASATAAAWWVRGADRSARARVSTRVSDRVSARVRRSSAGSAPSAASARTARAADKGPRHAR